MLRRKFRSWGLYGNKDASIARLMEQFKNPDSSAKKKLVIDSDDVGIV